MKQRIQITAVLNNGASEVTITTQTGQAPKLVKIYKCTVNDEGEVNIEDSENITLRRATLIRKCLRELA